MSGMRGTWLAAIAVLLSAAVVAVTLPRLRAGQRRLRETSDVYVLPPPEQVVRLSLGHRAALADYLWAHVLVEQGLHTFERRRFEHLTVYLDTINVLDPQFRDPYLMADALITFQANDTPVHEVRKAREIMERGVAARPLDAELWLVLGQFVAYIAPGSYLSDEQEIQRWRRDGALMLARAAELGSSDSSISWQAIGGAGILHRAGERDAAIRFLRRTLAVTDDEELKEQLQRQLRALMGEQQADIYNRRDARFRELWRRDAPFTNRTTMLLLGPPYDTAYCAGGAHRDEERCARTWREWAERFDAGAGL
jgi:hypothetical protein